MRLGTLTACLILGLSACCGCRSRCPDCECPDGKCPAPAVEPAAPKPTKPDAAPVRPKLRPRGEITPDT